MFSIALIGIGNQGREHLAALSKTNLPIRLAAIVDPAARPEDVKQSIDVPILPSVKELPAEVEGVIIATPPRTYNAIICEVLESRKHVLLEKPLGVDLSEALFFVDLAAQKRKVLMPAVQRRFHPSYLVWPDWRSKAGVLREALIEMEIVYRADGWRSSRLEAGGGILFDLGFHAIDLAQQIFGDLHLRAASFFDENGKPCHDGFDSDTDLLFHAESGVAVRVVVRRGRPEKRERVLIRGDQGLLEIRRDSIRHLSNEGCLVEEERFDPSWNYAMQKQLKLWLQMIEALERENEDLQVWPDQSAWNGAAAMQSMEEAYAIGRI